MFIKLENNIININIDCEIMLRYINVYSINDLHTFIANNRYLDKRVIQHIIIYSLNAYKNILNNSDNLYKLLYLYCTIYNNNNFTNGNELLKIVDNYILNIVSIDECFKKIDEL